ncbi:helix-turn-helix domain-containing protein [Paenibacillus alginolyticus]|uniref:helix-turn-helix domain-containing protein n=1 Tax=Paenibacillus alginolyticus TaxID=59839 RepID=UPI00398B78C1
MLGWSQRQLAEAAGTNQARISQIEAGHEGVKMGTIDKVFKALGLGKLIRPMWKMRRQKKH